MEPQYLSPRQVETIFPGLTPARLARWRWARTGPIYSKVGRQILYRRDAVETFLDQSTMPFEQGGVLY